MTLRPPRPTLFPYTTLFRSHGLVVVDQVGQLHHAAVLAAHVDLHEVARRRAAAVVDLDDDVVLVAAALEAGDVARSEEHTSELQSLRHLVCRLLLEKKTKKN